MIANPLIGFIIGGNCGNEKYMEGYVVIFVAIFYELSSRAKWDGSLCEPFSESRDLVFRWGSSGVFGYHLRQPERSTLNAGSFDSA
jgi:hypothetical protein